jgi:hypothetical protein
MKNTEKKFYNEVIKPQIGNIIKISKENCISIALAHSNGNKCGFALIFAKNNTGDETLRLTTFNMSDSFRYWVRENYELFIKMFKENGITPYFFFDERVLDEMARKELISTMEGKDLDMSITI